MNELEYLDDIANELDIEASEIKAHIVKYGVNGSQLDRSNGIYFDSKADSDLNDAISRVHNSRDENAAYSRSAYSSAEEDAVFCAEHKDVCISWDDFNDCANTSRFHAQGGSV